MKMIPTTTSVFVLQVTLLALHNVANGLELDITEPQSIRDVSANIAYGMKSCYTGNNTGDVTGNSNGFYLCIECNGS